MNLAVPLSAMQKLHLANISRTNKPPLQPISYTETILMDAEYEMRKEARNEIRKVDRRADKYQIPKPTKAAVALWVAGRLNGVGCVYGD